MADLLFEVLSEEIPAGMQQRAAQGLHDLVVKALADQRIAPAASACDATPRRLLVTLSGLPGRQEDLEEERKGPRVGAPEKAVEGFARSAGIEPADLEQRDTDKGPCWFAVVRRPGRAMAELLAEVLPAAMTALPWPKSMRWGDHDVRWVRPIVSILALLDGAVVPFSFGPVVSGDSTLGHRFLAPARFSVTGLADYREKLAAAHVLVDSTERRSRIADGIAALARSQGLTDADTPGLLDEVAGLVEWPVPMIGGFDPAFMEVPHEVLVTEMTQHQRYFPLHDAQGALAPRFAFVANMTGGEGGAVIVAGNERVLAARLSDGRHFWDQDRKRTLESRVPDLDKVVFHAKLGTLGEKVARVERLAGHLAAAIPGCDADLARRAARLAKADLTSEMVGEFPELQGVMGGYYARADGEDPAVAAATGEHYAPQGPSDACPTAPVSVAVALADKIDTLTGFFAIDEKPTGSRDPYALRRAALGVIRLVLENGLRLHLRELFVRSAGDQVIHGGWNVIERADLDATVGPACDALLAFFADRLKVHLREQAVRHDLVDAVFALSDDDLVRLLARVEALQGFVVSEDGANLHAAYKRAANILRIEEKKDGARFGPDFDPALLAAPEEKAVAQALAAANAEAGPALDAELYQNAMTALAGMRQSVDAFFDGVTVNADDPALRTNRLRLLSAIRATLDRVADFSRIEG
ncbi:MAG: glycine--tRNA ligase subunit beta [Proteobacteria bacterium]|nr:glycine--tRNA ligase subunit beta [Pseudomonadota bacterium]